MGLDFGSVKEKLSVDFRAFFSFSFSLSFVIGLHVMLIMITMMSGEIRSMIIIYIIHESELKCDSDTIFIMMMI